MPGLCVLCLWAQPQAQDPKALRCSKVPRAFYKCQSISLRRTPREREGSDLLKAT